MGFFSGDNNSNYKAAYGNANLADKQYGELGTQLGGDLEALRRRSQGQGLLSTEMLRQGLQQNLAAQQSMAAGAAPQNQAMAALHASRNAMQLGSGMAGQAAQAGIQERQAAEDALVQAMLQRQQMAQNQALQNRQLALQSKPQSWLDRFGGAIQGAASLGLGWGKGK